MAEAAEFLMLLYLFDHTAVELFEGSSMWRWRMLDHRRDCRDGWRERNLFVLMALRRWRRRWRRLCCLQLVIAMLHLVEEVEGSVVLRLLVVVEKVLFIFFIRVEIFNFRFFFFIIRFQINLVDTQGTGVSHGCHVLPKYMLRKV